VRSEGDLARLLEEARAEAESGFGNGAVYVEKLIERPRHIEVQVVGDAHGNLLHFFERDCSLQRRNQKIFEESPAPNLDPQIRQRLFDAALKLAAKVGYVNAGTLEFLVSSDQQEFYFLEMNTRIQVEHPITELNTDTDLLKLQFLVAAGEPLPLKQGDLKQRCSALEFRVYGEDVASGFSPTSGKISLYQSPAGPGIREESWTQSGTVITPYYDSLIAKLCVVGKDRAEAIARSRRALDEFLIEGIPTTLDFHRWVIEQPAFINGELDTGWIEREYHGEIKSAQAIGPLIAVDETRI
jgi:acetyl-CoA carboxylase, biotin carboxylase subunit